MDASTESLQRMVRGTDDELNDTNGTGTELYDAEHAMPSIQSRKRRKMQSGAKRIEIALGQPVAMG